MTTETNDTHNKENEDSWLTFFGNGSTYFGIVALNVLLTLVTFGLYYPWAKASYRKYIWNETEFKNSRFVFNGTGKEMFKGFLIAYAIIIGFYVSLSLVAYYSYAWLFLVGFYLLLLLLMPFAIFAGWRYRVSRTSWRGIFFSFDGKFTPFLKMFVINLLLTIITFGIYGAWMRVNIQKFLFSHTTVGDLRLGFKGEGANLLGINILWYFVSIFSLGILSPIWIKERFNFTINNSYITDGEKRQNFQSTLENGEAMKVLLVNFLLLVVTVGLAFPWVFIRSMRMFMDNTSVPDAFDYDNLSQSESNYKDATGDEMTDMLDLDFGF